MNSRKKLDWKDKVARTGCLLLFIPLLFGYFLASFDVASRSIEIRRFRNKRHLQAITNAFQFQLSQNETLHVLEYSRGAMQEPSLLSIVIEGIDNMDSFLSRFQGGIEETSPRNSTLRTYQMDIFREPFKSSYSRAILSFFYSDDKLNAEIYMVTFPSERSEFRKLQCILNSYNPIWLSPYFLFPVIVHIALITFRVVRIVRKKSRTTEPAPLS